MGELAEVEAGAPAAPAEFPPVAPDAAPPAALTWRLRSPLVPCSVHAMGETRADALFVGCNGGLVYRFDGVRADVSLALDESRVVSLLWASPSGEVWAGAQSGWSATSTTEIHRWDGTAWKKIPLGAERITSLTGAGTDVWITTKSEIRRWNGASFVTSYVAPAGELRSCAFASATRGFCTGTAGLAVTWDGVAWTPMTSPPWTDADEVLGVELGPFDGVPVFFWARPAKGPNGEDAEVHVATWKTNAFQPRAAKVFSFTSFEVPRRRTSHAVVNARTSYLLAIEEQYGKALIWDPVDDVFRSLCGPVLAFSAGEAKTRVGGHDGLLATVVGSGDAQLALSTTTPPFDPRDLSVAPGGAAWARIEDTTACGSVTDRLVRYQDGQWRDVAGPQSVQSGRGLAALAEDQAFTLTVVDGELVEQRAGAWSSRGAFDGAWSLSAKRPDDVWIGGYHDELAHFDGKAITTVAPRGLGRQVEQVVADEGVVWMVARGYTQADTDVHVYRFADGKREAWNMGVESYGTHVAAVDGGAWVSGSPAQAWDGTSFRALPFDASNVWARAKDEVYFTFGGDIFRWDGKTRTRVYHGFMPIRAIEGARERAFAVGNGGLTIELGSFPPGTK